MADKTFPSVSQPPTGTVSQWKGMEDGTYAPVMANVGLSIRAAGVLHRDAITAIDKITPFVTGNITTADNGAGTGSLTASLTYDIAVVPGNRWGPTSIQATINTQATAAYGGNTGSIRLTFGAATGADWYDIFLSDAAAPLWVARVTEAQRAAGDFEVTAVGTVASGGGNPAGTVDVNVAGTGIATSNAVFVQNNAYTPATPTAISCADYAKAMLKIKLALTDLRSAPTLRLVPFFRNELSTGEWHQGSIVTVALLGALGQSLEQEFELDVRDTDNLVILVDTISGNGAACSICIELAR